MIHHSYTQTLREFNSLYKEAVRSDFNWLNGLMEYNNKPFTYSYQCHEATLAFANALNNTIAGLFYIILNDRHTSVQHIKHLYNLSLKMFVGCS